MPRATRLFRVFDYKDKTEHMRVLEREQGVKFDKLLNVIMGKEL